MREYRGYYEIAPNYTPRLGLELMAQVSTLMHNRTHWQDSVEIVCRLKGYVTVEVEQVPYRMGPGDVIVIDSHVAHQFYDGDPDGLQLLLVIGSDLFHRDNDDLLWLSTMGAAPLAKNDPEINALRTHCARLAELCAPLYRDYIYLLPPVRARMEEEGIPIPVMPDEPISSQVWHTVRAELHSLIALLLRHTIPTGKHRHRVPQEFVRCVEFVQENYTRRITADDVAAACGYSRRTVFRLFQNYMGIPFKEYLSFIRIDAACELLQSSPLSTADIAACVGLSESQFYRVFQQITGMTPGDWQRAAPGQGQLHLSYAAGNQTELSRMQLGLEQPEPMDWDWIYGRKGWDF